MINRDNYEIWFLDYFEGVLSEEDIGILYDFLKSNLGLKKEFENFEFLSLDKEKISFGDKEKLKHNLNIKKVSGLDEFETLAVKNLEGEITEEERKELDSIIKFSPEKKNEYKAFDKTILIPKKDHFYDQKEKLKRKDKKVIPLWIKYISSAAAILLIIIFVKNINSGIPDQDKGKAEVVISPDLKPVDNDKTYSDLSQNSNSGHQVQVVEKPENKSGYFPENNHKNSDKSVVLTGEETQNLINSKDFVVIDIGEKSLPSRSISLLKSIKPGIKNIYVAERKKNTTIVYNTPKQTKITKALTPKEFLIKKIKTGLDIDDKNYDKLKAVEIASASLEKLSIGSLELKKDPDNKRKHLALNIGKFGIERIWQ